MQDIHQIIGTLTFKCVLQKNAKKSARYTLVNVYVDLVVFTRIAGTS